MVEGGREKNPSQGSFDLNDVVPKTPERPQVIEDTFDHVRRTLDGPDRAKVTRETRAIINEGVMPDGTEQKAFVPTHFVSKGHEVETLDGVPSNVPISTRTVSVLYVALTEQTLRGRRVFEAGDRFTTRKEQELFFHEAGTRLTAHEVHKIRSKRVKSPTPAA